MNENNIPFYGSMENRRVKNPKKVAIQNREKVLSWDSTQNELKRNKSENFVISYFDCIGY